MEYITSTLGNLVEQTAFMNLTWGNFVMIGVCVDAAQRSPGVKNS